MDLQEFINDAQELIDQLSDIFDRLPDKGLIEEDSQKLVLLSRLSEVQIALNGTTGDDLLSDEEIEQLAIRWALNEAERKKAQGKLFKNSDDVDISDDSLNEDGDAETVYSIISCATSGFGDGHSDIEFLEDQVDEALRGEYPDYF